MKHKKKPATYRRNGASQGAEQSKGNPIAELLHALPYLSPFNPRYNHDRLGVLVSRNIKIAGHRTSIRLEPDMWSAFLEISVRESRSLDNLATLVHERKRHDASLTAAIRVFILAYFRAAATENGHMNAGHGLAMQEA